MGKFPLRTLPGWQLLTDRGGIFSVEEQLGDAEDQDEPEGDWGRDRVQEADGDPVVDPDVWKMFLNRLWLFVRV